MRRRGTTELFRHVNLRVSRPLLRFVFLSRSNPRKLRRDRPLRPDPMVTFPTTKLASDLGYVTHRTRAKPRTHSFTAGFHGCQANAAPPPTEDGVDCVCTPFLTFSVSFGAGHKTNRAAQILERDIHAVRQDHRHKLREDVHASWAGTCCVSQIPASLFYRSW